MPSPYRRAPLLAASCAALALAAALTGPAWADPAPAFEQLLAQALTAPTSAEADANLAAAEARLTQAGVRPNPELAVEVENVLGSGPFQGADGAETTVSLSQDLELWGRRGARVGVAEAERQAASWRRQASRLEVGGALANAYAEAEAAQRRYDLAEETLALTVADARAALSLVEEGREPLLRGIQGESEAAAARAALDEARAERDAAFAALTALAGGQTPLTSVETSLLDRLPPAGSGEAADAPAVLALAAEREAAQGRVRMEQAQGRPDVRASLGVRRLEAEDATALTMGMSLQLPLFDRNRGSISAAEAEVRAADARLRGARLDARASWQAAAARRDAAASRVSAADASVAAASEAYRLTRIGFEAGRLSQLELRSARAGMVQARETAIAARLSRAKAEADLARLEGRAPFGAQL
ncbi:TolC family protein [uncultured Brevundimonas sp.]|uniref:TolC family protein n=1 Tax=uncultured Brevundimonas sp. TaxID=213418 RepID=UPI0025F79217|nr:TolC family protein [uncultured Brevundimonas sp.]